MLLITFESHATSVDNECGVASGHSDPDLSKLGYAQALDLGVRRQADKFAAVYCSDLRRSYLTAEVGLSGIFPIVRDSRLREVDYGDLTFRFISVCQKAQHISDPFPNGESFLVRSLSTHAGFLDQLR